MNRTLPPLLSLNGGYVDTASYLALHGLFAAHVTGNFVTLGAALVSGASGAIGKLLALPVFCVVVVAIRLFAHWLRSHRPGLPVLRVVLCVKLLMLLVAAFLAIIFGPFAQGDSWAALLTGMALVSAMAVQNAAHRIHLPNTPPSTLMTGTTTQMMLDLADHLAGVEPAAGVTRRARFASMSANIIGFAAGCGLAALLFAQFGEWCFGAPLVVAAGAIALARS